MTITHSEATVHLLCGYNGAGKTTYAKRLAETHAAIRFSLDEWMLRLYPGLSYDSDGYGTSAEVCKNLIWDVALEVLRRGLDVVLDWNQWSRSRRAIWRDKAAKVGHPVVLHFIDVPVDTAIGRCAQRAAGSNPGSHVLTPGDVRKLALIFEKPTTDEGMPIEIVRTP